MSTPAPRSTASGIAFAVGAYGLWGLLPAYFVLLAPAGPLEIVAWRIVLALVCCVILVSVTRSWRRLVAIVRDVRTTLSLGLAGVFILVNWLVYVYATLSGQVVEAALGYFTNPIVTVLLGVFVLKERMRPLQWVSVGVSVIAVIVLGVDYGRFPWIAIVLAVTFGVYGLIKKRLGARVDAISGMTLETAWLALPASIVLGVLASTSGITMGVTSGSHTALLLCAGAITAVPLLLFASAARRLPLTLLGLSQYLAPLLQFIIGVAILHEIMPTARWIGFAIMWAALGVLSVDLFRSQRRTRRVVA